MQFLGYLTPVKYIEDCDYAAPWFWYSAFGTLLILLTIADYWAFYFNPLQKNVFLDQSKSLRHLNSKAVVDETESFVAIDQLMTENINMTDSERTSTFKSDRNKLVIDKAQFKNIEQ